VRWRCRRDGGRGPQVTAGGPDAPAAALLPMAAVIGSGGAAGVAIGRGLAVGIHHTASTCALTWLDYPAFEWVLKYGHRGRPSPTDVVCTAMKMTRTG